MLYFVEQCGFVYTESFELLPDFLLLRLADDIRFIVEVEYCWLAFVTVYAIKEESSRLPDDTRVIKHWFYTKDFLNVFGINYILKMRFLYLKYLINNIVIF